MKLEVKSFHTKVARRIFMLFIICAILPIAAVALVSFGHVKKQLNEQSKKRLLQQNKAMAVSIYERLLLLEAEIKMVASNFNSNSGNSIQTQPKALPENFRNRFRGLALITDEGNSTPLFGRIQNPPELTQAEKEHILSGKALLCHQLRLDSLPRIFMYTALDPKHLSHGVLMGEINRSHLWKAADGRPPMTEICILDQSNNILFSSLSGLVSFPGQSFREMASSHLGQFEWNHKTKAYLASYWSIFLKPNFFLPEWIVVLSESNENVLLSMAKFKRSFPVIIILSLGMVFFLSISLIRRNMVPIEILREATRKIAQGVFGHKVEIKSGDEFESLGRSFNEMSKKLKEGQALLIQAAKLGTMGQMAAGIIHEIKQPLTAIYGHLQLFMMEEPTGDSRKRLDASLKAVERLNVILTKFQSFSHMSEEIMENLSVTQVIGQVYNLLEHQFNMKQIRCIIENKESLPIILGDNHGLQQVFSNLLINAVHALEDKQDDQRIINIKTYSFKDKVFVEVEDNGCGIPKEIKKRIFDPFFTTKGADKGTGLGMAIIESILHKHHARISVESEIGVGTKFTIVFPALAEAACEGHQSSARQGL